MSLKVAQRAFLPAVFTALVMTTVSCSAASAPAPVPNTATYTAYQALVKGKAPGYQWMTYDQTRDMLVFKDPDHAITDVTTLSGILNQTVAGQEIRVDDTTCNDDWHMLRAMDEFRGSLTLITYVDRQGDVPVASVRDLTLVGRTQHDGLSVKELGDMASLDTLTLIAPDGMDVIGPDRPKPARLTAMSFQNSDNTVAQPTLWSSKLGYIAQDMWKITTINGQPANIYDPATGLNSSDVAKLNKFELERFFARIVLRWAGVQTPSIPTSASAGTITGPIVVGDLSLYRGHAYAQDDIGPLIPVSSSDVLDGQTGDEKFAASPAGCTQAVLIYRVATKVGSYTNGAAAYQVELVVAIYDVATDTLSAEHGVDVAQPPGTLEYSPGDGRDGYGEPDVTKAYAYIQTLLAG